MQSELHFNTMRDTLNNLSSIKVRDLKVFHAYENAAHNSPFSLSPIKNAVISTSKPVKTTYPGYKEFQPKSPNMQWLYNNHAYKNGRNVLTDVPDATRQDMGIALSGPNDFADEFYTTLIPVRRVSVHRLPVLPGLYENTSVTDATQRLLARRKTMHQFAGGASSVLAYATGLKSSFDAGHYVSANLVSALPTNISYTLGLATIIAGITATSHLTFKTRFASLIKNSHQVADHAALKLLHSLKRRG